VATSEQLYEINKNTLAYMVQDVKRNIEYMQTRQQFAAPVSSEYLKPHSVTENKEEKFMAKYDEFQQNYQSMFDKKVPETVDFSEKYNEGPITGNMEDLIQKHLRERDEELKRYAPPPFFGGGQTASNKLKIDSAPNNIEFAVEELSREPTSSFANPSDERSSSRLSPEGARTLRPLPSSYSESNKPPSPSSYSESNKPPLPPFHMKGDNVPRDTTVKWLDNENSDKIQVLETEITMLKNQVLQMSDKISFLINVNKDIFDFSAQRLRMTSVNISGGFLFDPQGNP
jgi:hypothetical protein